MSRASLSLKVSTPLQIIVDAPDVVSFRGEDKSGGFGILPGHVDLLTVLTSSVIRWRQSGSTWNFCALRGGVLTVAGGTSIRIACRQGVVGTDLERLEDEVKAQERAESEAARKIRVEQAKLHARAIRQIMLHLSKHQGAFDDGALERILE